MFAPLPFHILCPNTCMRKLISHKILETNDYFQNININVVFLLINFLFYMQNTFQCLHRSHCRFYVFILVETNFIYTSEKTGTHVPVFPLFLLC